MKAISKLTILIMISAALLFACGGDDHAHNGDDHGHSQEEAGDHSHAETAESDHGHDHENGDHAHEGESADEGHDHAEAEHSDHDHATAAEADQGHDHGEPEAVSVTKWTDKMELFMEYPPMIADEPGRFIIHLTHLDGSKPVRDGTVKLEFTTSDGHTHNFLETELLREGIFAPTIQLHDPGDYQFKLYYTSGSIREVFEIENFTVYQSAAEVPHMHEEETGGEIGFLKEQQWKIPFATATVETREIKRSAWAIGEVLPNPRSYAEIVSPVDGVVQVSGNGDLALPGSTVKRGTALVTISPPVQGTGWASTKLAYEQAQRDYERAQRLKEKQAISDREYEGIRDEYLAMKAAFESLSAGGEHHELQLRAPITGKVIEWQVRPGQRVNAGDKLMAIVDPELIWLRVNLYEHDYRQLGRPVGAFIKGNAVSGGWAVSENEMRVLTTGGALDPATRTIPVLLEVANREDRLRVNESTPVELYSADGESAVAAPKSAVYEDDGMDVVFVQTGGETFEKRIVTVGPHYSGWVAIYSGLRTGERVVTTGGYQVKLASASGEIGHGHAH